MKQIIVLIVALGFVAGVATAQLSPEKQAEINAAGATSWGGVQNASSAKLGQAINVGSNEDTGTMQYDDGNFTALPVGFGIIFGNRFSQGIGGVPLSTITLNSFSFFFLEDDLADTGLTFQPSDPLNATSFSARVSVNILGLANSGPSFSAPVLNVIPQSALGTTGMFSNTFFLGGWLLNSATMFPVDNECMGLATNVTGSGFRGYVASSGTGPQPFSAASFQVILRANVTSPNPVPVELMAFDVEE